MLQLSNYKSTGVRSVTLENFEDSDTVHTCIMPQGEDVFGRVRKLTTWEEKIARPQEKDVLPWPALCRLSRILGTCPGLDLLGQPALAQTTRHTNLNYLNSSKNDNVRIVYLNLIAYLIQCQERPLQEQEHVLAHLRPIFKDYVYIRLMNSQAKCCAHPAPSPQRMIVLVRILRTLYPNK